LTRDDPPTDSEPGHLTSPADAADDGSDWTDPRQQWDRRYAAAELVWSATPNRLLAAEVADVKPGRALDLGTGEGRNAIWLAENGWDVTAVDFSAVGLEKGRKIAQSRGTTVSWVLADLREYRPEAAAFDLVLLIFIHLADPDWTRLLESARTGLAPGGTLLVIGHDSSNLENGVGGPQDPALLYSAADVTAALPDLAIMKARPVSGPVQTPDGDRTAIDVVVRLVAPA
jgi:SAM-dependent methyltransferase